MVRIWLGHHGLVGEVDGVEEVGDGVGQGHGLVEGRSAIFHHGRGLDGGLVEADVGGYSGGHGVLERISHGTDIHTGLCHTIGFQPITHTRILDHTHGGSNVLVSSIYSDISSTI